MKPATFTLDRCLYDLLQDGDLQHFTIRELRDAYAERRPPTGAPPTELRQYIYAQVARLKRVGWILPDDARRRRDQTYLVQATPTSLQLRLVDRSIKIKERSVALDASSYARLHSDSEPVQRLGALAKEIRLDMLSSLEEAERYKQLVSEMPQLKARVDDDYLAAKERSSRLLGHLRAVENTLKLLGKS